MRLINKMRDGIRSFLKIEPAYPRQIVIQQRLDHNLKRHRAEEKELGYEWEQWQVLQLQELERYRQNNRTKFTERFNKLNTRIEEALRSNYQKGGTEQERKILNAIRRGFSTGKENKPQQDLISTQGGFFGTNDSKLDTLIKSTVHDMSRAETAVLRRADDQYRKIIFNAQVYANTGAGTYEKAIDMATKDFLSAGINSIEYKNGSRHTISDYSSMAIRTASKRAYLQGEGAKRKEWKIPTVILNKRTNPCPLCASFVGKVFIDDVWSDGNKDGISPATGLKYPLLSDAIAKGLYHPNCQDSHTTYFEGISTPPEDSKYTADELDEIAENYKSKQQLGYCKRQADKYERLEKYSLDEDNKANYGARVEVWKSKAKEMKEKIKNAIEKNSGRGIIKSEGVKHMSISSIELPIEQRNTGKGNPNAVLTFGVELNSRQKKLLESLISYDSRVVVPKRSVKMVDLSALTAYTGDEFAMFTKGGHRLIIRGDTKTVNVDVESAKHMAAQGYRWSGHTHPGTDYNCLLSSDGDKIVLKQFKQKTSVIYNSKGQYLTFDKE